MYKSKSYNVILSIVERPWSIHPFSFMKLMVTIEKEGPELFWDQIKKRGGSCFVTFMGRLLYETLISKLWPDIPRAYNLGSQISHWHSPSLRNTRKPEEVLHLTDPNARLVYEVRSAHNWHAYRRIEGKMNPSVITGSMGHSSEIGKFKALEVENMALLKESWMTHVPVLKLLLVDATM